MILRKTILKTSAMLLIQSFLCLDFAWAGNFSAQSTLSPQIMIADIKNTMEIIYKQVAQNENLLVEIDNKSIRDYPRVNLKNYLGSEVESENSLLNFLRNNSHLNKEIFPRIKAVAVDMDGTIIGGTPESEQNAIELLIRLLDVLDRIYIVSVNELQSVERNIISKLPIEKT